MNNIKLKISILKIAFTCLGISYAGLVLASPKAEIPATASSPTSCSTVSTNPSGTTSKLPPQQPEQAQVPMQASAPVKKIKKHKPVLLVNPCLILKDDTSIPSGTDQLIIVSTTCPHDVQADLTLCQKKDTQWTAVDQFTAVVGQNGIVASKLKKEGDMMTPEGIYPIGTAFGYHPIAQSKLSSLKLDYRYISDTKDTNNKGFDKFIDDPKSAEYNSWVSGTTTAKSYEEMSRHDDLYEYGLVLNYNMPAVKNKGSAIFMHVWRSENQGTAGCIALAKQDLLKVLHWLDKDKHPMVKVIA